MIAKLIFNFDKPEDEMEFKLACKGKDLADVIWDILHDDHRLSKHCETKYDSHEIKEIIYEHLKERSICLDELIQ